VNDGPASPCQIRPANSIVFHGRKATIYDTLAALGCCLWPSAKAQIGYCIDDAGKRS
jgi:hypothetical protein